MSDWQELSDERDARPSHAFRVERLEAEQQLLERRLRWAIERGDDVATDKLSRRLDQVEEDLERDLRHWRERRGW